MALSIACGDPPSWIVGRGEGDSKVRAAVSEGGPAWQGDTARMLPAGSNVTVIESAGSNDGALWQVEVSPHPTTVKMGLGVVAWAVETASVLSDNWSFRDPPESRNPPGISH